MKGAVTMTATSHTSSIHIDAPVETVFEHVKDPQKQFDAYYQKEKPIIPAMEMAPDAGEGSTWQWQGHLLFLPIHGTNTREEYVPNKRFVDHSSTGPRMTFTFEPDQSGTTLTLFYEFDTKVPFLDKVTDTVVWNPDRDLGTWLSNLKAAIEA